MKHEDFYSRYNEIMYDERDCIESFLKKQYDLRYGRQRDTWHFEPAIEVVAHNGSLVLVHDIKLDEGRFVVFNVEAFCDKKAEWECFDFAYGELSKVIEALPDAKQIQIRNAVSDIASLCRECSLNLEDNPFNTKINGETTSVTLVDYIDGRIVAYNHDGKVVNDGDASDFLVGLRDHINTEVLHRSNEYKKLMELLSLQENMRFECQNYGDATFDIYGTDMTFDVSSVHRDDKGNLVIYGTDIDADICDSITLEEKDIRSEYLTSIITLMEKNMYHNIMDSYNGHNPTLVNKINAAWRDVRFHNMFATILLALVYRDNKEYERKGGRISDYSGEYVMGHAYEILEDLCDDEDLECILKFLHYTA